MSSQEIFRFAVVRQPDTKKSFSRHNLKIPLGEDIPSPVTLTHALPSEVHQPPLPLALLAASRLLSSNKQELITSKLKGFRSSREFISVLDLVPHALYLSELISYINDNYDPETNVNDTFEDFLTAFTPTPQNSQINTEQVYEDWNEHDVYDRLGLSIIIHKYIKRIEGEGFNSKLWENRPLPQLSQLYAFYECLRRTYSEDESDILKMQQAVEIMNAPIVIPEEIRLLYPPRLRPSGTTDLLIVKKHLIKYSGGEVAHIENVLASETRSREHSRLVESETIFEEERETETTEERELETTEKEEMERTASEVINENTSMSAGVSATYKYGEMLEVNAHADFAYDKSVENSVETSKSYSKEVIDKSVSKIRQKTVNKMKKRMLQTTEEKNLHSFENSGDNAENISGIYQWLNKTYKAEIWNYGLREMYDIMLPDPSRYLRQIFSGIDEDSNGNKIKINLPELSSVNIKYLDRVILSALPDDISSAEGKALTSQEIQLRNTFPQSEGSTYYEFYTAIYGVTDVKAPPEETIFLTLSSGASQSELGNSEKSTDWVGKDTIEIPAGYETKKVTITLNAQNTIVESGEGSKRPIVGIAIGDIRLIARIEDTDQITSIEETQTIEHLFVAFNNDAALPQNSYKPSGLTNPIDLKGITGTLTTNVAAAVFSYVSVHFYIECVRSASHLEAWRLDTFSKLSLRYDELLEEHESKTDFEETPPKKDLQTLAKMNPQFLKKRIEDEIKRLCIEKLMGKQSGGGDGYKPNGENAPLLKTTNDGDNYEEYERVVRFLQHAFEWENITYLFYPYYWDKKENWLEKLVNHYKDTEFDDFAKSGFTRVRLPVRPGFQLAVNHYLTTDETYFGQPLPNIGDELHVPFIEEQKESLGAPGDETPWPTGENQLTWNFEVPTDLVQLRSNLPIWQWDKETKEWKEGD